MPIQPLFFISLHWGQRKGSLELDMTLTWAADRPPHRLCIQDLHVPSQNTATIASSLTAFVESGVVVSYPTAGCTASGFSIHGSITAYVEGWVVYSDPTADTTTSPDFITPRQHMWEVGFWVLLPQQECPLINTTPPQQPQIF